MRLAPLFLMCLLAVAPGSLCADAPADAPVSTLSYSMKVDPLERHVSITGTVTGHPREDFKMFNSLGLRKQVKIAIAEEEGHVTFRYRVDIDQGRFENAFHPVLNDAHYTGFMSSVLVAPKLEGVEFKEIPLVLEMPEGWNVVTSKGLGTTELTLGDLRDLAGTLVCAGDYDSYSFELANRDSKTPTRFYLAIHGERDWDDEEFVAEFKRLARGQMDYFGGKHPAPAQFLALHLLPGGYNPNIPGFNRRVPDHDTVLALHTPARPRDHFEFLGMLAHEHLHNWYPNAMKSDLGPWFMEGLNDYVAYRGLLANDLHSRDQFSQMLSKWHREYEMCVRTDNQRLMPYRRGMIAAWVLDIELRRATDGKNGLTDVLLRLIEEEPDGGIVQRPHLLAMLKEVSGTDMEALYRHLVEDEGAIDLATHLDGTGFRIDEKTRAIAIRPETDAEKKLFDAILSE